MRILNAEMMDKEYQEYNLIRQQRRLLRLGVICIRSMNRSVHEPNKSNLYMEMKIFL